MKRGSDYSIKKKEKGPLQRFKNQNLILKKFGEAGLQIYKAITGKRTTEELKQDLGMEDDTYYTIIEYMEENDLIELEPASPDAIEEEPPEEEITIDEGPPSEEGPELEELAEEEEFEEEIKPLEEDFGKEIDDEAEERPDKEVKKDIKADELEDEFSAEDDKIRPIEFEDFGDEEEQEAEEEAKEQEAEKKPEEPSKPPKTRKRKKITEKDLEPEEKPEDKKLSRVERIIKRKYGRTGLKVYELIDGQRTAEEIMNETGLSESRLVEVLDFMDEQGIIKLDYPKGKKPPPRQKRRDFRSRSTRKKRKSGIKSSGFSPMIESDEALKEARGVASPVEIPVKAPLDIVKSVQMKAKTMLKFGKKGSKVLELIDGNNDVIGIALKSGIPLYEVTEILRFMMENGFILMKPLTRTQVHKKYGDDGYAVYKVYGKEGLMLYELIGSDMEIKEMADQITEQRETIIDMFIFIHQVLGIELPIDREVLSKQLEL
jgi:hypothetical protein